MINASFINVRELFEVYHTNEIKELNNIEVEVIRIEEVYKLIRKCKLESFLENGKKEKIRQLFEILDCIFYVDSVGREVIVL